MAFTLPELPWAKDALAPTISAETIDYHYGKHHKAYVDNLNKFVAGTKYEAMSLEEVVKASHGQASEKKIFNNAAQVWNHTFYWHSLAPKAGGEPTGAIAARDRQVVRQLRRLQDQVHRGRGRPVRLGLGVARQERRRLRSRSRPPSNAETPFAAGKTLRPDDRRLGARLLHRLPQRAPEVRRGVLEARQLGLREQELRLIATPAAPTSARRGLGARRCAGAQHS